MTGVELSNFQPLKGWSPRIGIPLYLTIVGVTFEVEWTEPVVEPDETVYLQVATHTTKHTLFYERTLKMNRELGIVRTFGASNEDGSLISTPTIFNLRSDSTVDSGAVIERITAPTGIVGVGSTIALMGIAAMGQGQSRSGETVKDEIIRILQPNVSGLFTFQNLSDSDTFFQATFRWFELDEKSLPSIRNI